MLTRKRLLVGLPESESRIGGIVSLLHDSLALKRGTSGHRLSMTLAPALQATPSSFAFTHIEVQFPRTSGIG